jgi:hypothetical protein
VYRDMVVAEESEREETLEKYKTPRKERTEQKITEGGECWSLPTSSFLAHPSVSRVAEAIKVLSLPLSCC